MKTLALFALLLVGCGGPPSPKVGQCYMNIVDLESSRVFIKIKKVGKYSVWADTHDGRKGGLLLDELQDATKWRITDCFHFKPEKEKGY